MFLFSMVYCLFTQENNNLNQSTCGNAEKHGSKGLQSIAVDITKEVATAVGFAVPCMLAFVEILRCG
jgi:hypothetical protein